MTDKFLQSDSYRQGVEAESMRFADLKDRLVRESEYKIISTLTKIYGNAKLSGSTTDLKTVEGETSTAIVFTGAITVHATVEDARGVHKVALPVPVDQNTTLAPEIDEVKQVVDVAPIEAPVETFEQGVTTDLMQAFPLNSSLDSFRIVDDGSTFLKVYHPTLDTGRELGVVGKLDWANTPNHEAILKEIFANQVDPNHATLTFTGSYVEPTIEIQAAGFMCDSCNKPMFSCECDKVDKKEEKEAAMSCEVCHQPMDECSCDDKEAKDASEMLSVAADSFRQNVELEASREARAKEKFTTSLVNAIASHIQSFNIGAVRVQQVDDTNLDESYNGHVRISASYDGRILSIPVEVKEGAYVLPKKAEVYTLLGGSVDTLAEEVAKFDHDAIAKIQEVDAQVEFENQSVEAALEDPKPTITKTAGEFGGIQYIGPVDTMRVERHLLGLPDDTEVGTIVYADGHHWKLTQKNDVEHQLGKEADSGSTWTFEKVPAGDKEPKVQMPL
jgi:hypothetical protein